MVVPPEYLFTSLRSSDYPGSHGQRNREKHQCVNLGMAGVCNSSTGEAERRGLLRVQGYPGVHKETPSRKEKKKD